MSGTLLSAGNEAGSAFGERGGERAAISGGGVRRYGFGDVGTSDIFSLLTLSVYEVGGREKKVKGKRQRRQ